MDIDNLLTVEEVARIMKVTTMTVREMFRVQRLRGFKVGKAWRTTRQILEEDLAAMASGERAVTAPAKKKAAAAKKTSGPVSEPAPPEAVEAVAAADPAPVKPAPRKRAAKSKDADDDAGTPGEPQQFLF